MTLFPATDAEVAERRDQLPDRLFLGSAGWSYDDWDGVFYPDGTSSRDRLTHYARHYKSVEVDSTFYGTPRRRTVAGWYERTPDDFIFAAKFPRTVTHEARLVNCAEDAYDFVDVMTGLGEKLGPLLIQLPPSLTVDALDDLARLLEGLPDGLTYAVEVRHRSWLVDEFAELLKKWRVATCLTCSGHLRRFWRVTSRVAYIRWLGQHDAIETFDHVQIDREEELDWWGPRIRHFLDQGGVVFGYVNNHYAGHSPATIDMISDRLAKDAPA